MIIATLSRVTRQRIGLFLFLAVAIVKPVAAASPHYEGMPDGTGTYQDLVSLYDDFLEWRNSTSARRQVSLGDVADNAADVFPKYDPVTVDERREKLKQFQRRLRDMAVPGWNRHQQVDYLAVRSRLDQHEFLLNVSKPWSRDPGFYVDRMLPIAFVELPVAAEKLQDLRVKLSAVPILVEQAQRNLTEVSAEYADLAIFNLTNADGVGSGHPHREAPPPGVLGWYDDLLARVEAQQPALQPDVLAARRSVQDFLDWLRANRSEMTAKAGVGRELFDWYLKHVKMMPYDADDIVLLGERELDRLWALYALERHRNRDLPELGIATSAQDYAERIETTDRHIRDFLVEEEVITIPDYVGDLPTGVPWIERPNGPNFWEQIQFRDPSPDHLHAVIPGHRFDGVLERHNDHPIRGRLTDGARAEGWGVYLEEGMLHLGIFENRPRTRELIYIFGIFRAARAPADVWLQLNEMTISEAIDYWQERTPYLDEDVARVDAGIYLRRPPGYGLGYTIGMVQMQQLLADSKMRKGDAFVLREFHDELMATGRLPLSLIRWEMTGLNDEIRELWARQPLPRR